MIQFISGGDIPQVVKSYCKTYKLKLLEMTDKGFIAFQNVPVKAGMEYLPGKSKYVSIPIRKIGTKKIFTDFLCYPDKDIVCNGIIKKQLTQ